MSIPLILAEAYVHDLNPVLIRLGDALAIRYYGLSYIAGFIIAWLLLRFLAKTGRIRVPAEAVLDLIVYGVAGVLIGGRLGYVIFYSPSLAWSFSADFPFWGVLRIADGGMASHGGMLGLMAGGWLFARRFRLRWLHVMDCIAFAGVQGFFLGRIANFINGELWGKPIPAERQGPDAPWWSIMYPEELLHIAHDDPGRLIDSPQIAQHAAIPMSEWAFHLSRLSHDSESRRIVEHWVQQIIVQVRAGNEQLIDALRDVLTAFYPSQLIQSFSEGILVFAALALIWLRPRRPGVIGAWFLIIYGAQRIATEVFRQPDEGVAVILGLQRGQLLSVLMILGGLILLAWVRMWREEERFGGLLKRVNSATV